MTDAVLLLPATDPVPVARSAAFGLPNAGRDFLLVLRLFVPYPVRLQRFSDDPPGVAITLGLLFVVTALADYAVELSHRHDALIFNHRGVYTLVTGLFATAALLFLVAVANARLHKLCGLFTGTMGVVIVATVGEPLLALVGDGDLAVAVLSLVCVLVVVRIVFRQLDVGMSRRLVAGIAAGAVFWASAEVLPANRLFRPAPDSRPHLNVERIYVDQARLVQESLAAVRLSTPDVVETYLVGFAPYAAQNVFENEVRHVETLFRQRFGAEGRSALLINSRATVADLPLANGHNLAAMLRGLAEKMGREDVLFLHMTSHGSAEHEFVVYFENLGLNDLSAAELGDIVQSANLPWHVIVVSACYSGGYIEALKSPRALIVTASAADKVSFGCEHGRDYTYFGEALFRDGLGVVDAPGGGGSLLDIDLRGTLERTLEIVREREQREGLTPSEPQIWIGEEMARRLPSW